jgi:hypothetical protein
MCNKAAVARFEMLPRVVWFEVFRAATMKNAVFWDVTPCGIVRTDVSKECISSIAIYLHPDHWGDTFLRNVRSY